MYSHNLLSTMTTVRTTEGCWLLLLLLLLLAPLLLLLPQLLIAATSSGTATRQCVLFDGCVLLYGSNCWRNNDMQTLQEYHHHRLCHFVTCLSSICASCLCSC